MGDIRQTNFRIDTETADKFRTFCESEGMSQAQGFAHLFQVLELNNAKTVLSNRENEITDFEMHTKALLDSFLNSLEICSNAEERAREEYAMQLDKKDRAIAEMAQRCKDLTAERDAAKEESLFLKERLESAAEEHRKIQELIDAHAAQVAGKNEVIDALRADLERTTTTAGQERQNNKQLTADIGKLQADLDHAKAEIEQERQRSRQQADAHAEQLKTKDAAISELQAELAKAMSIDGLMERISALQQLMQPEREQGNQSTRKGAKPTEVEETAQA